MTQEEIQSRLTSFPSFLDWERAQRECWPIRTIRISAAALRAFYTSWYAGPNGPLADSVEMRGRTLLAFQMPGARPVPVGQVAVTLDAWIEKKALITRYRYALQSFPPPIAISLVTYGLPNGQHLILDGNHRAVAAFLTGKEALVTALVICGPCDPHALPDLVHWSHKTNLRLCQHDRPSATALLALPFRFRCQTASDAAAFLGQHEWPYHQRDTEQIEVVDAAIPGGN